VLACVCLIAFTFTIEPINKNIPDSSSAASIPATPTIEPTAMPTEQPTITPTTVTIDLTPNYLELPKGSTGEFKSIENASSITDQDSKQWHFKQLWRTDNLGFKRFGNYYIVAMGTFYAQYIGQIFLITFEEREILCMIGDVKRDSDCINQMYDKRDKSIVEFVVDETVMSDSIQSLGNLSTLGMGGKLISIEREELE